MTKSELYKAGWTYAEQENGALAGMGEMPKVPEYHQDPDFETGYEAYIDQPRE